MLYVNNVKKAKNKTITSIFKTLPPYKHTHYLRDNLQNYNQHYGYYLAHVTILEE